MTDKKTATTNGIASAGNQSSGVDTQHSRWLQRSLSNLRVLLVDALVAAKYLSPDASWHPHYTGGILYFADRVIGEERPAVLVLADDVTNDIVSESVESDFRSYVIVGATLNPGVDLGKSRARRLARAESLDEHYWATFILDNAILVTLGTPLSWCRLIGEILNAQMPTPFVQRRICAHCHALNDYTSRRCNQCQQPLMATGRLE